MEKLATSKRAAILRCLIEGSSILSTSRITGSAKNTIIKFLEEAGEACSVYQDKHMRNLPCKTIQLDEIWSFVGCREKARRNAKLPHPGDVWTWTAICADTKIIPSWRVGDRGMGTAYAFCADLSERFTDHLQITSDGLPAYKWAVGANFSDVDFAQLIKVYGKDDYGNDVCIGTKKTPIFGAPDIDLVSTSFMERANLTIRMTNRRFTRKTNGFSKKLINHCHMLAVCFMYYNYCRKHLSLKKTPAQAAGIASHQWTLENVVEMMDAYLAEKENALFESAFEAKWTKPRTFPKTIKPTPKSEIPLPWYLDVESGRPPELP